mmetsp:Transcript_56766/g.172825  ORF Transcript_56766/g.172825 Transcript_56766/m.172825 type:complete len:224 (-) Transcript_56766:357-1028(-)
MHEPTPLLRVWLVLGSWSDHSPLMHLIFPELFVLRDQRGADGAGDFDALGNGVQEAHLAPAVLATDQQGVPCPHVDGGAARRWEWRNDVLFEVVLEDRLALGFDENETSTHLHARAQFNTLRLRTHPELVFFDGRVQLLRIQRGVRTEIRQKPAILLHRELDIAAVADDFAARAHEAHHILPRAVICYGDASPLQGNALALALVPDEHLALKLIEFYLGVPLG